MMVYMFVFLRRRSTALFVLAVLESILLLNLFFYDWIHPAHFPLHFSISHLLFSAALLGALSGLSGLFVRNGT
jgi:hypothetical protein